MNKQATNTVLMIEPIAFGFNEETAENNYFQKNDASPKSTIQEQALQEFNQAVKKIRAKGVNVIVVKDTGDPHTPDSIFPNNWVSFHRTGTMALYPMYAENRRAERRMDIIDKIKEKGFVVFDIFDYSLYEDVNIFLEGTGSMILDRINKIAYAALSERTDKQIFEEFCGDFDYKPVSFSSFQTVNGERLPIYHSNVMMSLGENYAVICLDAIDDADERKKLVDRFTKTKKKIIEISEEQMHQFAGNILQVEGAEGKNYLVMSTTAYNSLTKEQIDKLNAFNEIIDVSIPTIEKYGGGSARCMIAEIFLPKKNKL